MRMSNIKKLQSMGMGKNFRKQEQYVQRQVRIWHMQETEKRSMGCGSHYAERVVRNETGGLEKDPIL